MEFSFGEAQAALDLFSRAYSKRGRIVAWFKRLFGGGASGPRVDDVLGLPVAVSTKDAKLYVRIYVLGARRKFGKGSVEVIPRVEAILFPDIGSTQVRTSQIDGIEDRFPSIGELDPFYRIVFSLPGQEGQEVSKRVWDHPNSMGVLLSGHFQIEKKGKKYDVPIVPLNLSLSTGILMEHEGPLVRPKEK